MQLFHRLAIQNWQWVAQNLQNPSFFFIVIHVCVSAFIFRTISVYFGGSSSHIFLLLWCKLWWKHFSSSTMTCTFLWPSPRWKAPSHLRWESGLMVHGCQSICPELLLCVKEPWHWAIVRVWWGRGSREPYTTLGTIWSSWCFLIRLLVASSASLMIRGAL